MADLTLERTVTVTNPQGFHLRPASMFVKLASTFQSKVEILKGNDRFDGKSSLDLLTLGAGNGTTLSLRVTGADAQEAIDALAALVESGFGESSGS